MLIFLVGQQFRKRAERVGEVEWIMKIGN